MIDGVSLVNLNVNVTDQELAKSFWTETVGFDLVSDQQMGQERWIRVTPPDRSVILVLGFNNPRLATFLRRCRLSFLTARSSSPATTSRGPTRS